MEQKILKDHRTLEFWMNHAEYYKQDFWDFTKHPAYELLTPRQKERMYYSRYFDFSRCQNPLIREELKFVWAYFIERKIMKITTASHNKWLLQEVFQFVNERLLNNQSFLEWEKNELKQMYTDFLVGKGILTKDQIMRITKDMKVKRYNINRQTVNIITKIHKILYEEYYGKHIEEKKKDTWDIRKLDIEVRGFNSARPRYTINFEKISQPKIREVVKKYEYERLKTKKYAAVIDDLKAINLFSKFLKEKYPTIKSLNQLTREIVQSFFGYIETLDMAHTTKAQRKGSIRVFLNLCTFYGWADTPKKKLVFDGDYRKKVYIQPRMIEEEVLQQLNKHLDFLPIQIARMVYVIQNVGMRVNELCQLKIGCTKLDAEGDYFLEYYQSKTERFNRVPISNEVAETILAQQKETMDQFPSAEYVFTRDGVKPIGQESFSYHINKLAYQYQIKDSSGNLYRFRSHHFRHTVATNYVNQGMTPNMIRMMLGQTGMKSVMHYMDIFDQTILHEMEEILAHQQEMIFSIGHSVKNERDKSGISLPHGICSKPISNEICPHANACYTCSMFQTDKQDIALFKAQLKEVEEDLQKAKTNGLERLVQINEQLKKSLECIIEKVEKG